MYLIKRALAFVLAAAMLAGVLAVPSFADGQEPGTKENPIDANEKFFAPTNCYLLNTELEKGDSDGLWYTFKAPSAGIVCIDARATDENRNTVYGFQLTAEYENNSFLANGEIFSCPVTPFRVSKNDVITIHMEALPDENGSLPALKIYCNIVMVYGIASDPVNVKSAEGFCANVRANKNVTYQDGTNGGLYGGKGIIVTANTKSEIYSTRIKVDGTEYTDKDKDGSIRLMLPGDPNAQLVVHPVIAIYNDNGKDVSYTVRVVDYAKEGPEQVHTHSFQFTDVLKAPTIWEEGEALYGCECGETVIEVIEKTERWKKGDVNNDGAVNQIDSNLLKRVIIGLLNEERAVDAADMDDNGTVNGQDSFIMKKLLIGQ